MTTDKNGPPRPRLLTRWIGLPDLWGYAAAVRQHLRERGWRAADVAALGALREAYRVGSAHTVIAAAGVLGELVADLARGDFRKDGRTAMEALCAAVGGDLLAVRRALDERAAALYREAVDWRIADGVLADVEVAELKACAEELGLDEPTAASLYGASVNVLFNSTVEGMLEDGQLSPEEDERLTAMLSGLKVNALFEDETIRILDDARRGWAINNAPLPEIPAPVHLQRGEKAYAVVRAEAWEERSRVSRVSYAGPALNLRVVQGVYLRAGTYAVGGQREAYEHLIGQGDLIVTSKRLIFVGPNKSISPRLDSILQIDPYIDGVRITRATGKPVLYRFETREPWFGAILSRARQDF